MSWTGLLLLRDERSGTNPAVLPLLAVGCMLALLGLAGSTWQKYRELGLLALAGTVGRGELKMERNFARDTKAFRTPGEQEEKEGKVRKAQKEAYNHRGERMKAAAWRWKGDKRVFLLPVELVDQARHMFHLSRDLLAAVTTLYAETPREDGKVVTSFRQLCRMLRIQPSGRVYEEINLAFAILRTFTIRHQDLVLELDREGRAKKTGDCTFGFVDTVEVVTRVRDEKTGRLKEVPLSKRQVEIQLSKHYQTLLQARGGSKDLLCSVPVAALEACRKLGKRQTGPAKNLVYYLAGRGGRAKVKLETLVEVLGVHPRWPSEARKVCENILSALRDQGVIRYIVSANDAYEIALTEKGSTTRTEEVAEED
ncbi:hypothetical protein Adeg_1374 [Ammonifex degensii KC4]|uniref:Uncharacterized protein n=1 Tax=Ammonifex degensii (strain DSM 10501 / KC4) TaxID=429009 RepID=C9R847_AMMDK|nr:hypothetical protein [Ammonifex degensii]ACX52476.1 hypothetical protein Adeg_1374 [Ammonifex degensii KC4]